MSAKCIFVAATDQHIGKTTTTLGLLAAFKKRGINVGYCKPLGQEFVKIGNDHVDKDALLFAHTMQFPLEPLVHSPVLTASGMTAAYIDKPFHKELIGRIDYAAEVLKQRHELVIFEGTGHPGVGSIVNLSNADVAKRLGSGVVLVLKGGIGNTYDRMMLCKRFFDSTGVPILGVIINKIIPEKYEKTTQYLTKLFARDHIPVLGFVPFEQELGYPLLSTIIKEVNGEVLTPNSNIDCLVKDTIVGSQMDITDLDINIQYLLVVSVSRLQAALENLQRIWQQHQIRPNLVGVIVSGPRNPDPEQFAFFQKYEIPVINTYLDTYETIVKMSHIEVKINTKMPLKIEKAIDLMDKHVDLDLLATLINLRT